MKKANIKDLDFYQLLLNTEKFGNLKPVEVINYSLFNFNIDDENKEKLFIQKALEVSYSLLNSKTFEYIKNNENYVWYLMMMQTSFFKNATDSGVSIRGAWLNDYVLDNTILYNNQGFQEWKDISLSTEDLERFIKDVLKYGEENKLVDLKIFNDVKKLSMK